MGSPEEQRGEEDPLVTEEPTPPKMLAWCSRSVGKPSQPRTTGTACRCSAKLSAALLALGLLAAVLLDRSLLAMPRAALKALSGRAAAEDTENQELGIDHWSGAPIAEKYKAAYLNGAKAHGVARNQSTAPKEPWPSLFCWSHILPGSEEQTLIESQLKGNVGIFTCNDFAVIAKKRMHLGKLGQWDVWTWANAGLPPDVRGNPASGDATSSFLNANTFIVAWDTLIKSKKLWSHDWVVKADPDAVFFPERLRWHVMPYSKPPKGPGPFYYLNCPVRGGSIYGSLEVYHKLAILKYSKAFTDVGGGVIEHKCKDWMPWKGWGEDLYMQNCLNKICGKDNAIRDYKLVGDDRCTPMGCTDGWRVAFHPRKSTYDWWACYHMSQTKQ